MESTDQYRQWLQSLKSLPEPKASEALRQALLKGTRSGGLTFTRAGIFHYFEHVHHYFGCPEDDPCDKDIQMEPLCWEQALMIPLKHIIDANAECDALVANLWLWSTLSYIVIKSEGDIRARWLKKSEAQRRVILDKAWPSGGLPTNHRPDIDRSVLDTCPHQRHSHSLAQYAFPHLNLEDLTKPNPLLILLNARGRHPMWKFAFLDYELAPLMHLRPALLEKTKYTMGLNNEKYSRIIECNTEAEAAESMIRGDTIHPLPGSHILSMQKTILQFLLSCVGEIMEDNAIVESAYTKLRSRDNPISSLDEDAADMPEPPALTCSDQDFTSLNAIVREACYRVPTLEDLGRLEALVSACQNAAEDHIWLLGEDPGYFRDSTLEHKEHRPELLPGISCGTRHRGGYDEVLWSRVLHSMATDCYIDLFMWNEVRQRISELNRLSLLYKDELGFGEFGSKEELPEDFLESLVEAWSFLEFFQLEIIQELRLAWSSSLEIRAYFSQECNHSVQDMVVGIKFTGKVVRRRDKELERVFTLFKYLWEPPVRQSLKVHTLVETLDNVLQKNERAKDLTSPFVASLLSKLSIVSECLRQLSFFLPWAKRVQYLAKQRQTELITAYAINLSRWHSTLNTTFEGTNLADLGKPGPKFRYPINKRRSRMNVENLRSAEAALDAFWHATDARFRECTGTTPHDIVSSLIKERELQRTPLWVEPNGTSGPSTPVEYVYIPISNDLHDPTRQVTGVFDKINLDNTKKAKSHGLAAEHGYENNPDMPAAPTNIDEQPTFRLDKRAHKVFKVLFHSPFSRDHPGDIPWHDFLYAMVATGFAAQKLQGSAWQFTPRNLDVQQPIQFHEPHPTHKLPFTWARRFGRRLARTYGWRGEMFQLA
ncbi:hypothetical protein J4E93_004822 [Alternaria ventricosa]|uniref:uncharacterized protein n=1 Tax=Alternaria ventricosa TaxID=1187951 RepID=UPI0020C41C6A|nr:uncharacterized protein J4E93_004822 [Alternaria ventricosa]KAI4646601.1 hypothetical protein J4E93_004822 [Alternaria ventricosa]